MLGGDILQDIPKHVLITSPAVTKGGTTRTKHFALICSSSVPIKIGGRAFRFSNPHYKILSKDGKLGKSVRGQRTTKALVRWTSSPISGAECDSLIDFSADLCAPYCVELFDAMRIITFCSSKIESADCEGIGNRTMDARRSDYQAISLIGWGNFARRSGDGGALKFAQVGTSRVTAKRRRSWSTFELWVHATSQISRLTRL
jgi:hypothetical protein